jgi:cyclohexa-1,5-dienecarbonyl-CoA hydratase
VSPVQKTVEKAMPGSSNRIPESAYVRVNVDQRTATITLDRPPLNVMNIAMMRQIHEAIVSLTDRCDILILRGAGEKGFSAGADIADHAPDRVADMLDAFHAIFRELWCSPLITVAAVHGHCLGGGCELATFCDFIVAAESAVFGQPEIKLGCFPPVAMVTFPRLVGMRAALDLILIGRSIPASEANRIGLVTRVVPDSELDSAIAALIGDLSSLSPHVLAMARRKLWASDGFDFEGSLESMEDLYLHGLMKTHDAAEGIRAFMEKRQPVWQGK